MGLLFLTKKDWDRAEQTFKEVLEFEAIHTPNSVDFASTQVNLAIVYSQSHRPSIAQKYINPAIEVFREKSPNSIDMATALSIAGEIEFRLKNYRQALDLLVESANIWTSEAPDNLNFAENDAWLALAYEKLGKKEQANNVYQKALIFLEQKNSVLGTTDRAKANFFSVFSMLYRRYIDFLVSNEEIEKAFLTLESFKGRVFQESLWAAQILADNTIPTEILQEYEALEKEHSQNLKSRIEKQIDEDTYHLKLKRLYLRRDKLDQRVYALRPTLDRFLPPSMESLEKLKTQLPQDTMLISYCVGENQTFIFSLDNNGPLQVHVIPISEEHLSEMVETLLSLIPNTKHDVANLFKDPNFSKRLWQVNSKKLWEVLIDPVAGSLGAATRLLIIPDGKLHEIPFASLYGNLNGKNQFLIEHLSLSDLPSASVYQRLMERGNGYQFESPPRGVGFGNPHYSTSTSRTKNSSPNTRLVQFRGSQYLTDLPHSGSEIKSLVSILGPRITTFLGDEALESKVYEIPRNTEILHFATHGMVDRDIPYESSIILSFPGESEKSASNGFLQAWEIAENLKINARLVMITACKSGHGKIFTGEGIVGLGRAFHYAGAQNVIAPIWDVDDRLAPPFVQEFYTSYKNGSQVDEALRQAMIRFIRLPVKIPGMGEGKRHDLSHPFFWAGFKLTGTGR